jgi:hypothetical protein
MWVSFTWWCCKLKEVRGCIHGIVVCGNKAVDAKSLVSFRRGSSSAGKSIGTLSPIGRSGVHEQQLRPR